MASGHQPAEKGKKMKCIMVECRVERSKSEKVNQDLEFVFA